MTRLVLLALLALGCGGELAPAGPDAGACSAPPPAKAQCKNMRTAAGVACYFCPGVSGCFFDGGYCIAGISCYDGEDGACSP